MTITELIHKSDDVFLKRFIDCISDEDINIVIINYFKDNNHIRSKPHYIENINEYMVIGKLINIDKYKVHGKTYISWFFDVYE